MEYQGIDVSKWQGNIDWARVKNAGIRFAMIRSGFGQSDVDPYFEQNVSNARAQDIPCGAYHYCYAKTVEEAQTEAAFFLQTVQGKELEYPLALDLEDPSLEPLGKELLTQIAETFLAVVEQAGYYAILYANPNWLTNFFDAERLSKYDLWLAHWTDQPSYAGSYGMWQYTSTGTVDGISGNVDRDISYKDYPAIIRAAGLNHLLDEQPTPPVEEPEEPSEPEQPEENVYYVKAGDTLTSIAQRFGTTVDELVRLNNLRNPNLIYVNQRILLPAESGTPVMFRVGDSVRVKPGATQYATGQPIPDWVKNQADVIQRIDTNRALLKNIYSWVWLRDLELVTTPAPETFQVGETVTIKASATNYATGQPIPSWVKGRSDTIQQISGDRALLQNIYSWVNLKDLEK